MPCLPILSQKSENDIANIIKKPQFCEKNKKLSEKDPNVLEKIHSDFSEEGK